MFPEGRHFRGIKLVREGAGGLAGGDGIRHDGGVGAHIHPHIQDWNRHGDIEFSRDSVGGVKGVLVYREINAITSLNKIAHKARIICVRPAKSILIRTGRSERELRWKRLVREHRRHLVEIGAINLVKIEILVAESQIRAVASDSVGPFTENGPQSLFCCRCERLQCWVVYEGDAGRRRRFGQIRKLCSYRDADWPELGFEVVLKVSFVAELGEQRAAGSQPEGTIDLRNQTNQIPA